MVEQRGRGAGRQAIVLFGGGGDLAMRMLHPSLYFLDVDGFLPEALTVVAAARTIEAHDAFVGRVKAAVGKRPEGLDATTWERYAGIF